MERMLGPASIAIVGLSDDGSKHGGRVLANLRKVGFAGSVVGVNPRLPAVPDVEMVARLSDLEAAPDLVVSAVPAPVAPAVVAEAAGSGGVIVFAGGFAESGSEGEGHQRRLAAAATEAGVRVLGPNSGGIIRPDRGLAASFLTCLDRPPAQIRSGPVGLVTQSGGTGSYVHNLAAAAGGGLAASISTGNEVDIGIADGIRALLHLPEVRAVALVLETVRDGPALVEAVGRAREAAIPVVACRIGTSRRGAELMGTHTGALAVPAKVLEGVLDSIGVVVTETPEEMLSVAEVLARCRPVDGDRVGIVTHSGGMAILLTDLAERAGVSLPHPGDVLRRELQPLLHQGSSDNPLDMGGIIGGAGRYAEVVDRFARSGDFDCVLAVSTAHPPAHTVERVEGLLALDPPVPIVHLWMAGDVGGAGLDMLRAAGLPVVIEPRAAMRAMAGLTGSFAIDQAIPLEHHTIDCPETEHETKSLLASWGLPSVEGDVATGPDEAIDIARRLGWPVVMKVSAPDLFHKTEAGGVRLGIENEESARRAYADIVRSVGEARPNSPIAGVLVERMARGFEVIVGLVRDPTFGPTVMIGPGGIGVEGMGSERFAPAPVTPEQARRLIARVPGLETALGRIAEGAVDGLASIAAVASWWFASSDLEAMEMNPIAWTGTGWMILDAVMASGGTKGETNGTTR